LALISIGSVDDFSIAPTAGIRRAIPETKGIASARVLYQASAEIPTTDFEYAISREPRGLALHSLRLEKGAVKFFKKLFMRDSHIYFVAWGWDMSGIPAYTYPDAGASADAALIPMKGGELREFLGSGALLFPPRTITSGVQVRMQIWESNKGVRTFGNAMTAVTQAVADSDLNAILNMASLAGGHVGVTIAAAKEGALILSKSIGTILKSYGDDVLDFYEGNYNASDAWRPGREAHAGHGTKIVLSRLS
jgi:hypothetical protein